MAKNQNNGKSNIQGTTEDDILDGGNGKDVITGSADDETLIGGNGKDVLDGSSGSDAMSGDNGKDVMNFNALENMDSSNSFDGGRGKDTVNIDLANITISSAQFDELMRQLAELEADVAANGRANNEGDVDGGQDYTLNIEGVISLRIQNVEILNILNLNQVNIIPEAIADEGEGFIVDEDSSFTTANVMANDFDRNNLEDSLDDDVLSIFALNDSMTVGSVTSNGDGTFSYDTNGKFESLGEGIEATDTFQYTISDGSGGFATATVTITIVGVNDVAELSSADVALDETNSVLETSGQLTITDKDEGEDHFIAQSNVAGQYGTFNIDEAGNWSFVANSAFDELNVDDHLIDEFTVSSADGTQTSVKVTINGTNDAAILSSADVELDESNSVLTTGGQLSISDVDSPETFITQSNIAGQHGTFNIDAAGNWSFVANSAFDELNVDDSLVDTFIVSSADGTKTSVKVTINGTNDAAILSSADVELDESNSVLTTGGQLSISDVDSPETFIAQSNVAGQHGTFSIDEAGNWSFVANSAFDELNVDDHLIDEFTVSSSDGTQTSVKVTINGTNDAPTIESMLQSDDIDPLISVDTSFLGGDNEMAFSAQIADLDEGDEVKFQVEVRKVGVDFTGEATAESGFVTVDAVGLASIAISIDNLEAGSYHWQARAIDANGGMSDWMSFGNNAESVADFKMEIFSSFDDNVDLNLVTADQFTPGSQYNALAGNDFVILPDAQNAASINYDPSNVFHGGDGNDTIIGGNMADTIEGGKGADTIEGGAADGSIGGDITIPGVASVIFESADSSTSTMNQSNSSRSSTFIDLTDAAILSSVTEISRDALGSLSASSLSGQDEFDYVDTSKALTGRVEGSLNEQGDVDLFKIHLMAGEQIVVDVDNLNADSTEAGTFIDSWVTIYNDQGYRLGYNIDNSIQDIGSNHRYNSLLTFEASTEGDYFIRMEGYSTSYTGDYRLNIGVGEGIALGEVEVDYNAMDIVSYAGSAEGVTVDLSLTTAQVSAGDANGDVISGIEGIIGSSHDDVLTGNSEANIIDAGAGDDTVIATRGADLLSGGGGVDTLDLSSINTYYMQVYSDHISYYDAFSGQYVESSIDGFENVIGSSSTPYGYQYNYFYDGADGVNNHYTGAPNTNGSAYNYFYASNNGGDNIFDGNGGSYNYAMYSNYSGSIHANLQTGQVTKSDGSVDTLIDINRLYTGYSNDYVIMSDGDDYVYDYGGINDFDVVSYEASSSGVTAQIGTYTHTGGSGYDYISFYTDALIGSDFDDVLMGNRYGTYSYNYTWMVLDNTLNGGNGDDDLWGMNSGTYGYMHENTFVFDRELSSHDTIHDFRIDHDWIDISEWEGHTQAASAAMIDADNDGQSDDAIIYLDANNSITVLNTDLLTLLFSGRINPLPPELIEMQVSDDDFSAAEDDLITGNIHENDLILGERTLTVNGVDIQADNTELMLSVNNQVMVDGVSYSIVGEVSLVMNLDGSFTIDTQGLFNALPQDIWDSLHFVYSVDTPTEFVGEATVTINILGDNDIPVAVDDAVALLADVESASLDVMDNDIENDFGDVKILDAVDDLSALGASLSIVDGEVVYDLSSLSADTLDALQALGSSGSMTDTFDYVIRDQHMASGETVLVYSDVILADAPVVYYQFNEASGSVASDSSGNGNDGIYSNGAVLGSSSGIESLGTALDLSTNDGFVAMPDLTPGSENSFSNAFTFEAWINPDLNGSWDVLYDANAWTYGNIHIQFVGNGFEFSINGASGGADRWFYNVFTPNEWQHLVATYDNSDGSITVYRNGEFAGVQYFGSGGNHIDPDNGQIGAWDPYDNGSLDRPIEGMMDEVAIYNTVLTEEQVANHYAAAMGGLAVSNSATVTVEIQGVNDPASMSLLNVASSVTEFYSVSNVILANIVISDVDNDAALTNHVTLSGEDADLFRLVDVDGALQLRIANGVTLDFEDESNPDHVLNVSVNLDDSVSDLQTVDLSFDIIDVVDESQLIIELPNADEVGPDYNTQEVVKGTPNPDIIIGGDLPDIIEGGGGADTLSGGDADGVPGAGGANIPGVADVFFEAEDLQLLDATFGGGRSARYGSSSFDVNDANFLAELNIVSDDMFGDLSQSNMLNKEEFDRTDPSAVRVARIEGTMDFSGSYVNGSYAGDIDMYQVHLTAGESISVDVDNTNALADSSFGYNHDTFLLLYDANGNQVTYNDDSGGDTGSSSGLDSALAYTSAGGGDYYIRVESYSTSTGNYRLNIGIGENAIVTPGTYDYAAADTVSYQDSPEGVTVDLSIVAPDAQVSGGDANGDILSGFENIIGSSHNDILTGDAGNNQIDAGDGDDIVVYSGGADRLFGGEGIDTLDLSDFNAYSWLYIQTDRYYHYAAGQVSSDIDGFEILQGSNLVNNYFRDYSAEDVTMVAGLSRNYFYSYNSSGEAIASFENHTAGVSMTIGSSGYDAFGNYNYIHSTYTGLIGSDFNDTLNGNSNGDMLNGNGGDDTLIGSGGSDRFVFDVEESSHDTINDFYVAQGDTIDLTAWNFASVDEIETNLDSGHLQLVLDDNNTVDVLGINTDVLDDSWFTL